MDPVPAAAPLGPPPFVFRPSPDPVEGPAFSVPFKLLATLLVGGSIGWGLRLALLERLGTGLNANSAWFLAALVMLAWMWWAIVRSRLRLDSRELAQTWIWTKRMPLADLAYARLIRVPGLDWLVAPRLYVRTLMGRFGVFYVADRRLAAECERLVVELKAFRAMR